MNTETARPEPRVRFRVTESYSVHDTDPPTGPATFFVEDFIDERDPMTVDPWFDTREEAQRFADTLNGSVTS